MTRLFAVLLLCGVAVLCAATPAEAQTSWPEYAESGLENKHNEIDRGPGFYLSIHKIVFIMILFWLWVRTCDWVNRDSKLTGMDFRMWTPIVTMPFLFALMFITLTVPFFYLTYPLLVLSFVGPVGAYVYIRNADQPDHNKVFTADHFRHFFSKSAGKAGVKVKTEKKMAYEEGVAVNFIPANNDQGNLIIARQKPAFIPCKELFAKMSDMYASRFVLDFTPELVSVKLEVDGVVEPGENMPREVGDPVLEIIKLIAGMDPLDRRGKQEGQMVVEYADKKRACTVASQGTKTGERAIVTFVQAEESFTSLSQLGMRDSMIEAVRGMIGMEGGLFLVSTLPRGGQTSTYTGLLNNTDRLLRDFVSVQDQKQLEPEVENVDVTTYDASAGETPDKVLPALIRKQPDAYVLTDAVNGQSLQLLLDEVKEDSKTVIVFIRAKDAAEALIRLLMLKAKQADIAKTLRGVLHVKLIRKLNEPCKEAYQPSPKLLQALGIPEGRVDTFYRERTLTGDEDPRKDPCAEAGGRPYSGRTGIFELLEVDDKIREVILKQPKVDVLRKVAKAGGHKTIQDEGALLVAQGITSVKELKRVLES